MITDKEKEILNGAPLESEELKKLIKKLYKRNGPKWFLENIPWSGKSAVSNGDGSYSEVPEYINDLYDKATLSTTGDREAIIRNKNERNYYKLFTGIENEKIGSPKFNKYIRQMKDFYDANGLDFKKDYSWLNKDTVENEKVPLELRELFEEAIEENPEEAAAALPSGSDIQKEAVQAIDGGRDQEVRNEAVENYFADTKDFNKPGKMGFDGEIPETIPYEFSNTPALINDGLPLKIEPVWTINENTYPTPSTELRDDKAWVEHPEPTYTITDLPNPVSYEPMDVGKFNLQGKTDTVYGDGSTGDIHSTEIKPQTINTGMIGSSFNKIPSLTASASVPASWEKEKGASGIAGGELSSAGNPSGTVENDLQAKPVKDHTDKAIDHNNVSNSSSGIMARPVRKSGHLSFRKITPPSIGGGSSLTPEPIQQKEFDRMREEFLKGLEKRIYEKPEKWSEWNITERYNQIAVDGRFLRDLDNKVIQALDAAF